MAQGSSNIPEGVAGMLCPRPRGSGADAAENVLSGRLRRRCSLRRPLLCWRGNTPTATFSGTRSLDASPLTFSLLPKNVSELSAEGDGEFGPIVDVSTLSSGAAAPMMSGISLRNVHRKWWCLRLSAMRCYAVARVLKRVRPADKNNKQSPSAGAESAWCGSIQTGVTCARSALPHTSSQSPARPHRRLRVCKRIRVRHRVSRAPRRSLVMPDRKMPVISLKRTYRYWTMTTGS